MLCWMKPLRVREADTFPCLQFYYRLLMPLSVNFGFALLFQGYISIPGTCYPTKATWRWSKGLRINTHFPGSQGVEKRVLRNTLSDMWTSQSCLWISATCFNLAGNESHLTKNTWNARQQIPIIKFNEYLSELENREKHTPVFGECVGHWPERGGWNLASRRSFNELNCVGTCYGGGGHGCKFPEGEMGLRWYWVLDTYQLKDYILFSNTCGVFIKACLVLGHKAILAEWQQCISHSSWNSNMDTHWNLKITKATKFPSQNKYLLSVQTQSIINLAFKKYLKDSGYHSFRENYSLFTSYYLLGSWLRAGEIWLKKKKEFS